MSYADFLKAKRAKAAKIGRTFAVADVHPMLHLWQRQLTVWACDVGRAAIWADTGLGKTFMQIEWLRLMAGDGIGLIVAPLAVCQQTVREAAKIGVHATYVREMPTTPGMYVTNYEMVPHFDPGQIAAVVLDEASILKQSDGRTRTMLIRHFEHVPYRLACTATPAPNDPEELTNQAEFLGQMTRVNMLAAYFVHDQDGWRLKGHGRRPMIEWMATWAVALRRPSDLGHDDHGYDLPGLEIIPQYVHVPIEAEGQLFAADLGGVGGRAKIRRETLAARVERAVEIVNESHFSAKLTTCHGSPNTNKTARPESRPTPNIEPDTKSSKSAAPAPPKRTANTCASTTSPTPKSSNEPQNNKPNTTAADASATPTTPNIENAQRHQSPKSTSGQGSTLDSRGSSASLLTSTRPCLSSKATPARSAERALGADSDTDSASITATTRGRFEDCCAVNATSDSASSETIPSSCERLPTTSNLEPWIIWCGLNDEQAAIKKALGDRAFSLEGSMSPEEKVDILYRWLDGERPVMISKASILGSGINMQHCARMIFVGLSDSYEQYYQAIRRCYRYGQTRVVHAHIVLSELESQIASNVARKEREASRLNNDLVAQMRRARHMETAS